MLNLKQARPFSKGTRQYLVFVGHGAVSHEGRIGRAIHPVIRSSSATFLGIPYPKPRNGVVAANYKRAMRAQRVQA